MFGLPYYHSSLCDLSMQGLQRTALPTPPGRQLSSDNRIRWSTFPSQHGKVVNASE